MRQHDVPKKPSTTGWLWWLAGLCAIVGAIICYFLKQNPMNPGMEQHIMLTATLTVVAVGVCVISATAHWWVHR